MITDAAQLVHRAGGRLHLTDQRPPAVAFAFTFLGMLQTVARSPHPASLLAPYTHVIIDGCRHIPAAGFEAVMKTCPARFILGLTATPRRKDGLQKLLHLQCGPIRHRFVSTPDATAHRRRLIVRTCTPDLPPSDAPIHQLWTALVTSRVRNEQIAADIATCLREGRALAVLSDHREHLSNLQTHTAGLLAESPDSTSSPPPPTLHRLDGSIGRRGRTATLSDLATRADTGRGFVLFATASLLGEGFDVPRLDTLFLTTAVSFSGRVV